MAQGLFFVLQVLPPKGDLHHAMVFIDDDSLSLWGTAPVHDKRELVCAAIMAELGFTRETIVGAKCTLEAYEIEAEARTAIARNRESLIPFAQRANN